MSRPPADGVRGGGVDVARGASVAFTPIAASSSSATATIVPGARPRRRVARARRTVPATRQLPAGPSPGASSLRVGASFSMCALRLGGGTGTGRAYGRSPPGPPGAGADPRGGAHHKRVGGHGFGRDGGSGALADRSRVVIAPDP